MTPARFRALGRRMVDWIADYWERVGELPVQSRARPGDLLAQLPLDPPEAGLADAALPLAPSLGEGEAWDAVFDDLEQFILPGLTHWQSPNFYAYFPCNASFPAILGEMLSAGLNVNGMLWATSPAATELEIRMLDWMARATGLPDSFLSTTTNAGGCIQGTASESTLIAMLAARARASGTPPLRGGSARGASGSPEPHLVAYASTQSHSSVIKAAMIAGLARGPDDRDHLRLIDTDESFAMRPAALEAAINEDLAAGRTPFFACATVGTTGTTAVDPVDAIAGVLQRTGIAGRAWLHVDAAHAGPAAICDEFRWMLRGVEHADSICMNPHKWLLTNFDCDLFWTRDKASLLDALSITPEYLRNPASESGAVTDFRDWQIPLGRRFRALKLWFVIRHYGLAGLRAHIREHVRLAALLESWVRADDRFEVAAPRTLNLVCFRLRGEGPAADQRNRELLRRLNDSGRIFLTHTVLPPRDGSGGGGARPPALLLRMAIGATLTGDRHVTDAWDLIRRTASDLAP